MPAHVVEEWSAQWPLPVIGIALLGTFFALRFVVPADERGRIKAGVFFSGAYLVSLFAIGFFRPAAAAPPTVHEHDWLRMLSVLLFAFAAVIASGLVLFDVVLARRQIPRILRDVLHGIAYLITGLFVLARSEVDVTKVFTASVLTTAVIGLALQETLGNIVAGLALQLERDFEVGDWIQLDGKVSGRIREVRWRATTVETKDGDLILIPNGAITRAMITNFSRPTTAHRQWVRLRVHFRFAPARVRDVVLEAVRAQSFVRKDPAPDCVLLEFKEDAVTYACRYWMDDFQRDDAMDSSVRSAIWYALHRAGMEIPFPSMNVNVTEMNEARDQRKLDEEYARRMDALSRVDVFRALDGQKIDRLSRRMRMVIFGPNEVILRQGDPGDSLYVVRSGQVVVQVGRSGGGAKTVATLTAGQFFGEMSLMTGESRSATVVAKSDVECYIVDKEAFQEILEEKPELAGVISEILSRRQLALSPVEAALTTQAVQKTQLMTRIASFFGIGPRSRAS